MVRENEKKGRSTNSICWTEGTSSYHGGLMHPSRRDHPQAGGTSATPCLCNSTMTLSTEGGFRPRGSGSHGFDKTSPIAASMLSLDGCICSWSCVSCGLLLPSSGGTRGLYIGGGHGKTPLTGGAGNRLKLRHRAY